MTGEGEGEGGGDKLPYFCMLFPPPLSPLPPGEGKIYFLRIHLIWIVEKGLEILIQNLLDIGAHLLASEIKNDWEDYGEVILKLGNHGIVPQEFSDQIKGMAGLRNILIHEYLRIDLNKLFDYLKYRLEDFIQFIRYIREYQRSSLKK